MSRSLYRRAIAGAAALALVALSAALPASAAARHGGASRAGWTITIASPTSSTPDWALPFASGDELTPSNVNDFEQLMYRPLYFFGGSSTVALNVGASLAAPPVYSKGDTSVSITLKNGRRWSDGEPVAPQGVVEWLNLLASYPDMWGDYLAPLPSGVPMGLPDDLRGVKVSGNTITLTLASAVNPTWFTYNELSQITPLPQSWDIFEPAHPHVSSTGPSSITGAHGDFTSPTAAAGCYSTSWVGNGNDGPSTTFVDPMGTSTVVTASSVSQASKCVDALDLLRSMSFDTADYTTTSTDVATTWGLSDGPWRLQRYTRSTGAIQMAPNLAAGASGQRPAASLLSFVPCTSAASCEALLSHKLVDQGVLPIAAAPHVASLAAAPSHNPLASAGFRESAVASWSTSYFPYNYSSRAGAGGHAGAVFSQVYFREAFQSLVNQQGSINADLGGYGVATTGPVPTVPATSFATVTKNPAPFSVARAAALLTSHGWHLAPGKETRCTTPAKCGPGIPKGTPLVFTIEYAPSSDVLAKEMALLKVNANKAGIQLTLHVVSANRVLDDVSGSNHSWDLASWDGGWSYAPDFYPSGEWLFASGSPWNVGGYAAPHATSLVEATLRSPTELAAYDHYLTAQLPVVWQPTAVTLVETLASLKGVAHSPLGSLTPESWRR